MTGTLDTPEGMETEPTFPPLMKGEAATGPAFDHAILRAVQGTDAGLVVHRLLPDRLEAALVLTPEVPLAQAMVSLPLCMVGFQNALGALAPPEVAVHLQWDGGLRINGARCGGFRVAASHTNPAEEPEWVVIGLDLPLWPRDGEDGGDTPDETVLYSEGCADVQAPRLLESWARHTLNWITRWQEEGTAPLHAEWRGLAHGMGEDMTWKGESGTFLGLDEDFGLLLRVAETTRLIPLTALLEETA